MENNLSLHIRQFNDRVRIMNQSQSKNLILSAQDARDLQADIFAVLAQLTALTQYVTATQEAIVQIDVDGGAF
jgi:hypothetical protein